MLQLRLIVRLVLLATLKTSVCSYNGLGGMPQNRRMSRTPLSEERSSNKVYVPYRGSIPNLYLSTRAFTVYNFGPELCKRSAIDDDTRFWSLEKCVVGTLFAPVCRVENANETNYMIEESYLTDGSPDDDPTRGLDGKNKFVSEPNVAFRVMTPTIPKFPEFTTEIAFHPPSLKFKTSIQEGKIFVFPKLGGIVATDDSILVDPSCHTNNTCGVAFLTTSVEAVTAPHVALDQYCGQTIDLNDTPVLNVFSHAGIGCKLFSDVHTKPNCELTITSNSAITANVTLVNFRRQTCGPYKLKFVPFPCEGVSKEVDVCHENAPTVIDSSEGKMQIKLSGSASNDWRRYGFIIRLEKVVSQCSYENAVQGTTDDFPQASTTAPAESPTDSPVQNPTDGSDVDLPEASLESSSATEFIRDPTESFVSGSPSISPKRPTNPHHLHMLLALGIEL